MKENPKSFFKHLETSHRRTPVFLERQKMWHEALVYATDQIPVQCGFTLHNQQRGRGTTVHKQIWSTSFGTLKVVTLNQ